MLWEASVVGGYRLAGLDGEIGSVRDFYFDDRSWVIRYLIADTGNWLTGIHISIARAALIEVNGGERHISVDMTREQIERSPVLSSQAPVSKQLEALAFGKYGSPEVGPDKPGRGPGVRGMRRDPHLRSTHHVRGYHVQAADGDVGVVSDFIIDDATWAIRYLVIDTQNWLGGDACSFPPNGSSVSAGASRASSSAFCVTQSSSHPKTWAGRCAPGNTRPGCMNTTIARDTGSMNR
jgi:hypothetical protein